MSFALALLTCVGASILFGAVSRWISLRWQWLPTLGAILLPLAALWLLVRGHLVQTSTESFQVAGQFAPIGDTVSIGSGAAADVVVRLDAADTTSLVWVTRDPQSGMRHVEVSPGMPVVFVNGVPVNAARLDRSSTIALLGQDTTVISVDMPRWPLSCLLGMNACAIRELVVTDGPASLRGTKRTVRLSTASIAETVLGQPVGSLPQFSIFRTGGKSFVTSSTPALVRVGADTLPNTVDTPGDSLTVGRGTDGLRFRFRDDVRAGRQLIFYDSRRGERQWSLSRGGEQSRFRVASGGATPVGTLPLIDLNDWPIARAPAYEGILARDSARWSWTHRGVATPIVTDSNYLFAASELSPDARGHIVRIANDASGADPLLLLSALWIAGAALLAATAVQRNGAIPSLRVLLLGLAYTLVFARSVLAIRVYAAPPSLADALTTLVALVIVLPSMIVLIERWQWLWSGWRRRQPGWTLRQWMQKGVDRKSAVLAVAALAASPVLVFVVSRGNGSLAVLAVTIVSLGIVGLMVVQRILMPPTESALALHSPLAILDQPHDRDLGVDRLFRAVVILLMLVFFYLELYVAQRVHFAAVAGVHLAFVAALWRFVTLRESIVPQYKWGWLLRRTALIALFAGAAVAVTTGEAAPLRSVAFALAAGVAAAVVAGVTVIVVGAPLVRTLRGGSFVRQEVLPPMWTLALPAVALLFSRVAVVRRFGITLGFALAVTAALVLVRVLAVLWHQDTRERMRMLVLAQRKRLALGQTFAAFGLCASLLIGHAFVDRGLLQLIVGVLLVTLFVGASALGKKALLLPAVLVVAAAGLWLVFVHASEADLLGGPMRLSTPRIRQAAAASPDGLQHQLLHADATKGREIVSTLVQEWGIRSHAALGGARGAGLFSIPFSGRAISAREAVTDNTYSVFVLAEHGFAGGVALLLVYVALACTLLLSGWMAARTFVELPRAMLLAACAAFIAVPALYMIAANVGAVALTGQNLPLLGLRSGADVALFVWVMTLAFAALPIADRESVKAIQRDGEYQLQMRRVRGLLASLAGLTVVGAALLVRPIWAATSATSTASFRLDEFSTALRALVATGELSVANGRIVVRSNSGPPASGSVLDNLVRRSNHDPTFLGSAHCLDQTAWLTARRDAIDVGTGCSFATASGGRPPWAGALTAQHDGVMYIVAGDRAALTTDVRAGSVDIANCTDTTSAHARGFDVYCGSARMRFDMDADALRLTVISGTDVTVNGARMVEPVRPVHWGDVVNVPESGTYVIDSVPRSAFAFVRLRNGELARVVAASTPPLLGRLDSLLAGTLRLPDSLVTADVEVTLDMGLTATIQQAMDRACVGTRQCSAILVKPETGDILSLVSTLDTAVHVDAYDALDANFRNHRAASVIKPLIAASVLARYPALARLAVEPTGEQFAAAAGWPITGSAMKSPRRGCPATDRVIGWNCFLPTSNNLFATTLGFLGAAATGPDGMPALEPGGVGPPFLVDGRRIDSRPQFLSIRGQRHYGTSPLARGLADFFGAEIGTRVGAFDRTLWAPLQEAQLARVGSAWQRVSPELPVLALDAPQFHDLHHLAGFMIGETENSWSNAILARAASRLYTGNGVTLRLLKRLGSIEMPIAEAQPLAFGAGRDAVLEGMTNVVRGFGTASSLDGTWPAEIRLHAKTGTLDSDGLSGTSEFMFVGGNARGSTACSVAGMIHVEGFQGSTRPPPTGKELFLHVILPALITHGPWHDVACAGVPRRTENDQQGRNAGRPAVGQRTVPPVTGGGRRP